MLTINLYLLWSILIAGINTDCLRYFPTRINKLIITVWLKAVTIVWIGLMCVVKDIRSGFYRK